MTIGHRFGRGAWPTLLLAVVALSCLGVLSARAEPDPAPRECPPADLGGQVHWVSGPTRFVYVIQGTERKPLLLPTCFLANEELAVDPDVVATVNTARGAASLTADKPFRLPPAAPHGSPPAFWSELRRIAVGPAEKVSIYATGRDARACPPGGAPAPPLRAPDALADPEQQVGSDLRALLAIWRPSVEVRLVRVQLLNQEGRVLARDATCRGNSLPLKIRAGDLRAGASLTLVITDDQDRTIRYAVSVVDPANLPQPQSPPGVGAAGPDWLLAAWRLQAAPRHTGLDSVARLAIASETSFGAQRLLGSIAAQP